MLTYVDIPRRVLASPEAFSGAFCIKSLQSNNGIKQANLNNLGDQCLYGLVAARRRTEKNTRFVISANLLYNWSRLSQFFFFYPSLNVVKYYIRKFIKFRVLKLYLVC